MVKKATPQFREFCQVEDLKRFAAFPVKFKDTRKIEKYLKRIDEGDFLKRESPQDSIVPIN